MPSVTACLSLVRIITIYRHGNLHKKVKSPHKDDSTFDTVAQEAKGYISRDWAFLKELDEHCNSGLPGMYSQDCLNYDDYKAEHGISEL
jgi:hypothetical protein